MSKIVDFRAFENLRGFLYVRNRKNILEIVAISEHRENHDFRDPKNAKHFYDAQKFHVFIIN